MMGVRLLITWLVVFCCFGSSLHAEQVANHYAVVSADPLASQAGEKILQQGGNAFDAAVAISTVLAVVEPYGSGIGGGGFWLLHDARSKLDVVVDGREVAPLAAHATMYLDDIGDPTDNSVNGPLAAGIPGVVAALEHITQKYGNLTLAQNLQPAIELAKQGFTPNARFRNLAQFRRSVLADSPAAKKIFLTATSVPELVVQTDLAATLTRIAQHGAQDFYQGETAQHLVAGIQAAGGIWTLEDLANYKIIEREPIVTHYHQIEVVMPPPPTSGGVVLTQILAMLENIDLAKPNQVEYIHTLIEAMRRAYRDRALYLGDPAFTEIPLDKLLNKKYAQAQFHNFDKAKASVSEKLQYGTRKQGEDTTHFSVVDSEGNYVAATLSINYPFGSGFVVPNTGVLLNDEMDDFVIAPDVPNVWGLIGSKANQIEPGKRMLSSMTPLFARNGQEVLIVGTPGGSRIISMLALALLEFSLDKPAAKIVASRRFHHQYVPDEIQFEQNALTKFEQQSLIDKGHSLNELNRNYGNMHAIIWNQITNTLDAAADPRGHGLAITHHK